MEDTTAWINEKLYPALFEKLPVVLPEFGFRKTADRINWVSSTKVKVTGEMGNVKGRVYVYQNSPGTLKDWTRDKCRIINFVMQNRNVSFIHAVESLACDAGIEVPKLRNTSGHSQSPLSRLPAKVARVKPEPKISYIDWKLFEESLSRYESNNLIQYLGLRYGPDLISDLIQIYGIGTSDKWDGSTIFWQIDSNKKIRTGKVMLYDRQTCKRVKEENGRPVNRIGWVHPKSEDFSLSQCFFGEHLLLGNDKPVCIVEAYKSALIASLYLPSMIWLSCDCLDGLTEQKVKALNGRKVILFPDLAERKEGKETPFEKWSKKAKEFRHLAGSISVSDLLEKKASAQDRAKGLDLADYLLKFDLNAFLKKSKP